MGVKVYNTVLFWLGGVLLPTLPEVTMTELVPHLKGHAFVHTRQQLRAPAEAVALGRMNTADYCARALEVCQSNQDAAALEQKLIASAALSQPLAEMIRQIPSRYECWLVVDYPKVWYEALADRDQIDALFGSNRLIFTEEFELLRLTPDVFYCLPQKVGRPMDDCIIIDADSGRAVQSLKNGLAAIFYVYLHHLKLELALQEIWQTDADVMHPTSSERVKF